MSRVGTPSSSRFTSGVASPFDLRIDAVEAFGVLGAVPPIAVAVIQERVIDAVSYQRLSVMKHHRMRSRRRGQQFLAAQLQRYGRTTGKGRPAETLAQVRGEVYAVDVTKERRLFPGAFRLLEEGGTVTSQNPMAIPIGAGLLGRTAMKRWIGWRSDPDAAAAEYSADELGFGAKVPRGGDGGIFLERGGRLVGVYRRRRVQKAVLGFYDRWTGSVRKEVEKKLDADLERLLTAAGRAALELRRSADRAGRAEYTRVYREAVGAGVKFPAARRAAREAAKAVRDSALARPGERA